jgi:hypothetical protein
MIMPRKNPPARDLAAIVRPVTQPTTARLFRHLTAQAMRFDYTKEPDPNGGGWPRVPAGHSMSKALGSQQVALLLVLASLDDAWPIRGHTSLTEGYTAAELAPLVGMTPNNTKTKLTELERNGWVKSSAARDKSDRQTYWRIDV